MATAPWLLSLSLMWFGWGASTTMLGIFALGIGTAWVIGLFAADRTPRALLWATGTWALGWLPALVFQPWLLAVPAALLALHYRWRRRETAWRQRLREFEDRERRGA